MGGDRRTASRHAARVLLAGALAIAIAACESPSVPVESFSYDPTALSGNLVYHWELGHTITVFADTVAQADGYDIRAAVAAGARAWENAANYGEVRFRLVSDPHDADVIVRFFDAPSRVNVGDCNPGGSGAGETIFCAVEPEAPIMALLADGGGHVKVEIVVDPYRVSDAFLSLYHLTRPQHFAHLVTHELGHAIGIGGHSPELGDIMNSLSIAPAPSAADAATLRWVLRQHADIRL